MIKQSKDRDTKYRGITKKRDRWIAQIAAGGQVFNLGTFGTETQAARAFDAAVYWLRDTLAPRQEVVPGEKLKPYFFEYNFPDDIDPNLPPLISARLRDVMQEVGIEIPPSAPVETPFIKIFHTVMADWFEENPHATEWSGNTTALLALFKYAVAGISVRQLGNELKGLSGIRRRRSNGFSFLVIARKDVKGSGRVTRLRLDYPTYRVLLLRLKSLYREPSGARYTEAVRSFHTWSSKVEPVLFPDRTDKVISEISLSEQCETKSAIAACESRSESTCAPLLQPGLQQTSE